MLLEQREKDTRTFTYASTNVYWGTTICQAPHCLWNRSQRTFLNPDKLSDQWGKFWFLAHHTEVAWGRAKDSLSFVFVICERETVGISTSLEVLWYLNQEKAWELLNMVTGASPLFSTPQWWAEVKNPGIFLRKHKTWSVSDLRRSTAVKLGWTGVKKDKAMCSAFPDRTVCVWGKKKVRPGGVVILKTRN